MLTLERARKFTFQPWYKGGGRGWNPSRILLGGSELKASMRSLFTSPKTICHLDAKCSKIQLTTKKFERTQERYSAKNFTTTCTNAYENVHNKNPPIATHNIKELLDLIFKRIPSSSVEGTGIYNKGIQGTAVSTKMAAAFSYSY